MSVKYLLSWFHRGHVTWSDRHSYTQEDLKSPLKSRKCGKSAVDYLTFQRHLMYISGCMTIISLIGPLPANTMGKLLIETNAYFAKTTIGNLSVDNILIWGCFQIYERVKSNLLS